MYMEPEKAPEQKECENEKFREVVFKPLDDDFLSNLAERESRGEQLNEVELGLCGYLYHRGKAVPQDYAKAFEIYYYHSRKGEAWAQDITEKWLKEVYNKAMEGSQDAAKLYANANYYIGLQFEQGVGVERNCLFAIRDYAEAAKWGDEKGRRKLAKLCQVEVNKSGQEISDVGNQILELHKRIFNEGEYSSENREIYANSVYQLGVKYELGIGAKQDYVSAVIAYAEAAKWGDERTRSNVESKLIKLCHLENILSEKEKIKIQNKINEESNWCEEVFNDASITSKLTKRMADILHYGFGFGNREKVDEIRFFVRAAILGIGSGYLGVEARDMLAELCHVKKYISEKDISEVIDQMKQLYNKMPKIGKGRSMDDITAYKEAVYKLGATYESEYKLGKGDKNRVKAVIAYAEARRLHIHNEEAESKLLQLCH